MPVRITGTAPDQYLGSIRRYLRATVPRPPRPAPAHRLIEAYSDAVKQIEAGPRTWFTHPRPYPKLVRFGFRWIKVHRYWFGYLPAADPIITNILDEAGDIPARVSQDRTPASIA